MNRRSFGRGTWQMPTGNYSSITPTGASGCWKWMPRRRGLFPMQLTDWSFRWDAAAFAEGPLQEAEVFQVGLEPDVERIPNQGNESHRPVDRNVGDHASAREQTDAVLLGNINGIKCHEGCGGIAQDRDQPNQCIKTESDTRDLKLRIEQLGQFAHTLHVCHG